MTSHHPFVARYEEVPFANRWDKFLGDVSVNEAVERTDEPKLSQAGTRVNDLLFYKSGWQDDENDRWVEIVSCAAPLEGVRVGAGAFKNDYRWSIAFQYNRNSKDKDRVVPWGYESKDHNGRGDAVWSNRRGTADVGLTHAFRDLRVTEQQAAVDLRRLMDAIPLPMPSPEEWKAKWDRMVDFLEGRTDASYE